MFTIDDTRSIFYGDHPDFDPEPVEAISGDTARWVQWETRICKHTTSGEFWSVDVGMALTEMQDDQVYESPERVERREVKTSATSVSVTLPTGAGPLADFLATEGHLEAAQAVRGLVLSWERVESGSP